MTNEGKVKEYVPTTSIVEVRITPESKSPLARSLDPKDKLPRITIEEVEDWFFTLKDAKEALGVAHLVYARRLVTEGKIEGIKVKVPGGERWLVTKESVERYSLKVIRSGEDRNYTLRINPNVEAKVRSLLKANGIEYELSLSYEGKAKKATPSETVWAKVVRKIEEK